VYRDGKIRYDSILKQGYSNNRINHLQLKIIFNINLQMKLKWNRKDSRVIPSNFRMSSKSIKRKDKYTSIVTSLRKQKKKKRDCVCLFNMLMKKVNENIIKKLIKYYILVYFK